MNPLLINGHIRPRLSAAARRRSRLLFYSAPDLHRLLAISMFLNPSSCNPDRDVKRRRDDRMSSLISRALRPRTLLQHARIPDHVVGTCQDDPRRLLDIIYII